MTKIGIFIFACFAFALAQQNCPSDIRANIAPPKTVCSTDPNICPNSQVCCSCEWSDSSYCVYPVGTDPEEIKKSWDEYFKSSKDDKDEYDDDDCDDIMEDEHHHHDMHKEKEGPHHPHHPHPEKKGDSHDWMHKNKRCHDKHHHKRRMHAIIGGSVGLVLLVAIAVAVACLVRRRRMRMSDMQRKKSYIQSNLVSGDKAPLPPNMSVPELTKEELKATLGTDFTPSV